MNIYSILDDSDEEPVKPKAPVEKKPADKKPVVAAAAPAPKKDIPGRAPAPKGKFQHNARTIQSNPMVDERTASMSA